MVELRNGVFINDMGIGETIDVIFKYMDGKRSDPKNPKWRPSFLFGVRLLEGSETKECLFPATEKFREKIVKAFADNEMDREKLKTTIWTISKEVTKKGSVFTIKLKPAGVKLSDLGSKPIEKTETQTDPTESEREMVRPINGKPISAELLREALTNEGIAPERAAFLAKVFVVKGIITVDQ